MPKIKKFLFVALCLVMVMVTQPRCAEVGEPMPDFVIQTFDGKSITRAGLAGQPLLLVFWNTWCPNCMRELPKINRLAEKFGPQRLVVLAVNTGLNDNESKARTYWEKNDYLFTSGFDQTFAISRLFQVLGVPTVFLIDSGGIVRYKQSLPPTDMEEYLKQLM